MKDESISKKRTRAELIQLLVDNQTDLFKFCSRIKSGELMVSLCQLCHYQNDLAHNIWQQLFIQMFNLLNTKQQQNLFGELTPFVASGSHCIQKQAQQSAMNTFVESMALAKPTTLFLRPSLLAYLAKNHNLWHRAILLLENSLVSRNADHSDIPPASDFSSTGKFKFFLINYEIYIMTLKRKSFETRFILCLCFLFILFY
jgi:hypothetical protein